MPVDMFLNLEITQNDTKEIILGCSKENMILYTIFILPKNTVYKHEY